MLEKMENAIQAQLHIESLDKAIDKAREAKAAFAERYREAMTELYKGLEAEGVLEHNIVHLSGDTSWLIKSEFWDDHQYPPVSLSRVKIIRGDGD